MSPPSWVIRWEERPWGSDTSEVVAAQGLSRRQRLAARGPYRAAVPAAITHLPVHTSPEATTAAEDALQEITRFDAELPQGLDLSGELTLDSVLAVHRTLLHGADYAEPTGPPSSLPILTGFWTAFRT